MEHTTHFEKILEKCMENLTVSLILAGVGYVIYIRQQRLQNLSIEARNGLNQVDEVEELVCKLHTISNKPLTLPYQNHEPELGQAVESLSCKLRPLITTLRCLSRDERFKDNNKAIDLNREIKQLNDILKTTQKFHSFTAIDFLAKLGVVPDKNSTPTLSPFDSLRKELLEIYHLRYHGLRYYVVTIQTCSLVLTILLLYLCLYLLKSQTPI